MSVINFRRKEIVAKVVYYGPALSGKTTNVKWIHDSIPEARRGKLTSLATKEDRTLFFDYVPIHLGNIGGFKTKFQIFTVPGQVIYASTRRIVLQGVDGVVFVADSSPDAMEANLESLADLKENLLHHDKHLNTLPLVMQYNKRDLDEVIPIEDLESALNLLSVPSFRAIAIKGVGVLETLSKVSSLVLTHLKASIEGRLVRGRSDPSVIQSFDSEEVDDAALVRDLMAQIARVRPGEVASDIEIVDDGDADEWEEDAEDEVATRLISLPPRPSANRLDQQGDEAESATLTGAGATLVAERPPGPPPSPPGGAEETSETPPALAEPRTESEPDGVKSAEAGEETAGVTDRGPDRSLEREGHDEREEEAPAGGTEQEEPEPGPSEARPETSTKAQKAPRDPLAGMVFPKDEVTDDSTAYHIASLKVSPPPEQLSATPEPLERSGSSPETPSAPPDTPGARSDSSPSGPGAPGGESGAGARLEPPGARPTTPRPGPRLVEAPPTSLPTPAGFEVLDVGRPVREKGEMWAIPVTVRTPGDENPNIVVLRFTFDETEQMDQRMSVPSYVLAWLAGLTLLTLLALGLTLF